MYSRNPDDVPEPEDESQRIMLIELQEEQHVMYYSTLPGLGYVTLVWHVVYVLTIVLLVSRKHRPMVPLGWTDDSFNQLPFIMLDAISEFYHIDALQYVLCVVFLGGVYTLFTTALSWWLTCSMDMGSSVTCLLCPSVRSSRTVASLFALPVPLSL